MAMKKPVKKAAKKAVKKSSPVEYPKGQSERSIAAQSRRAKWQGYEMRNNKSKGQDAYGLRMAELERKNRGEVYQGEGGFWSTALQNKEELAMARRNQKEAAGVSQQMKQGVTKSGGYAANRRGDYRAARAVKSKSGTFKGKQAVKKTGKLGNARGMNSNSKNKQVTIPPIGMNQSAKLAHTLYGEPTTKHSRLAHAQGARLAAPSGPYIGRNRCTANDDTCEGPKARGTDFCYGHLRNKGEA